MDIITKTITKTSVERRQRLKWIVRYIMGRSDEIRAVSVGNEDEIEWMHRDDEDVPKRLAASGHAIATRALSPNAAPDEIIATRWLGHRTLTSMLPGSIPLVIVVPHPALISKSLVRIIRQVARKLVADPVPERAQETDIDVVEMPPSGTDDEMREENIGLQLILSELLGTSHRSIRETARARFATWHERGEIERGPDDPMEHRGDMPSYTMLVSHIGALRSAVQGEMTAPEVEQLLRGTDLSPWVRSSIERKEPA